MSLRTSASSQKKPFCKHCSNLGLPSEHQLRNDTKVLCPVILNTQCRNCGILGHTQSRCIKSTSRLQVPVKPVKKTTTTVQKPVKNMYSVLEDAEEYFEIPKARNIPPTPQRPVKQPIQGISYVDALNTTKKELFPETRVPEPKKPTPKPLVRQMCWADEDSDDE